VDVGYLTTNSTGMVMERTLVERVQRGDDTAFGELASDVAHRLYAVAYRILRDFALAEDATQETLLTIWREAPRLKDPDRFEAWSWRVLVNACNRLNRQQRRWQPSIQDVHALRASGDEAANVDDRDQLERAFRRIHPDQRAILVLQHYLGLSLEQISDLLGLPTGTVASRLHYARRAMRAALDADARVRPDAGSPR
jgi:RNA polymerase sigma-70 factor (ECF subfamily)